jgi:hypothetical protein
MAHLRVNIPDNQLQFFKNLVSKLGYDYTPLKEVDWYDELTAEQQEDIQMGLDDLDNGRVFSDKEVRDEIRLKIENAKQL